MKMKAIYTVLVSAMLVLSSCDNKDLCFDHDTHALKYHADIRTQYELEWQYTYGDAIDWRTHWPQSFGMSYESLLPHVPDGLRVVTYNADGTNETTNLPATGGTVYFKAGEHSLLFYNNDTEYIVFDDLASYATARATTRSRSRASYLGNKYTDSKAENTVNPPDVLFGHYIESYTPEKTVEAQMLPVTMHPLVFSYLVRYEFSEGLKYVALARGALAGMAESVYLNSGQTSTEEATILYDCTVEDFGAQAVVRSFGIPDFPNENYSRAGRRYGLNLEVRLKNGKTMTFDFDVTDQVAVQPHGGVIIVKGIKIPDDIGMEGGSGFDVNVNDWGDYEDIDLPL